MTVVADVRRFDAVLGQGRGGTRTSADPQTAEALNARRALADRLLDTLQTVSFTDEMLGGADIRDRFFDVGYDPVIHLMAELRRSHPPMAQSLGDFDAVVTARFGKSTWMSTAVRGACRALMASPWIDRVTFVAACEPVNRVLSAHGLPGVVHPDI